MKQSANSLVVDHNSRLQRTLRQSSAHHLKVQDLSKSSLNLACDLTKMIFIHARDYGIAEQLGLA